MPPPPYHTCNVTLLSRDNGFLRAFVCFCSNLNPTIHLPACVSNQGHISHVHILGPLLTCTPPRSRHHLYINMFKLPHWIALCHRIGTCHFFPSPTQRVRRAYNRHNPKYARPFTVSHTKKSTWVLLLHFMYTKHTLTCYHLCTTILTCSSKPSRAEIQDVLI
jgi:hypothetical protein